MRRVLITSKGVVATPVIDPARAPEQRAKRLLNDCTLTISLQVSQL